MPVYDPYASGLQTTTNPVDVTAATAPSAGQVLTAVDATHATWQAPGAIVTGLKAGTKLAADFGGPSSKFATVVFASPYPDANYAVTAIAIESGSNLVVSIHDKTAAGFIIDLNTSSLGSLVQVDWITRTYGE